nr:S1C family serine protease [uncultured Sellimonas sp.]
MAAQFHDEDGKEENESYSFLKETIKKPPINKKLVAWKVLKVAGLGFIFGFTTCVGFVMSKPWIEEHVGSEKAGVTIQEDQNPKEENTEKQQGEVQASQVMTLKNYQQMIGELNKVADSAQKSIVMLENISKEQDDVNIMQAKSAGVIVADNGTEILIMADHTGFENSQPVTALFYNGEEAAASVKKQDKALGIAVYAVNKSELSSNTVSQLKVMTLGNSNVVSEGEPVIAAGAPFGGTESVGFGVISADDVQKNLCDGQYRMLYTDIPGNEHSSGVLLNLKGEAVGFICPEKKEENILCAFAISEIKEEIERLSNGIGVSYMGINGTEVSDEVADKQDMPKGIYVDSAMPDSPAMKAGIQSGDILTQIGETRIYTMDGFKEELLNYNPGKTVIVKGKRRGADGYVDIQFEVTLSLAE